jgi:hypothetical protein
MIAGEMFAIVVLWNAEEQGAWVGWLTAVDHRSLRFSVADLADAALRRWLCDLPGWDPGRLSAALTRPDLHLVWRLGR